MPPPLPCGLSRFCALRRFHSPAHGYKAVKKTGMQINGVLRSPMRAEHRHAGMRLMPHTKTVPPLQVCTHSGGTNHSANATPYIRLR
ncbi:hypothetical protein BPSOL_0497 [Bifidobacterium pseudolongum]|jgi:hypothetical protein|nr:hypothetical protein BPSOL_0497 [Bifidobacterium pseudolongum]